jgi:hypothetical protein
MSHGEDFFVDAFLQPIVKTTGSYIKDTTDFLCKLQNLGNVPLHSLLFTMDVSSLYTNIPHLGGGKRAVAKQLVGTHRPLAEIPTNESLIILLDLVLTKNNFMFNGQQYLQVSGTAMGTKLAPGYVNLFMADFEEQYVFTYHTQPIFYGRFIEYIFGIWTGTRTELDTFISTLNQAHPTIKFTSEISDESVPFLDTRVHLSTDGTIYTDLYTKPTDSHNYLLFTSTHPRHCLQEILRTIPQGPPHLQPFGGL